MPLLQVKEYVNDTYVMLGNLTRDQVPIEIALKLLYNELDKRRIQMGLTENNQFLKSQEKTITDSRDQLVNIADLSTFMDVVAVHFVNPFNSHESPVEMVNFNSLASWEADGQLKVSLYGNPLRIRYSADIESQIGWNLKFWYEPDTVVRGINSNVVIPTIFKSLVTLNVARDLLPHAEITPEKKLELTTMFNNKIGTQDIDGSLENLWWKYIGFQGNYGNNTRRAFRAGQPHYRYRR